MSLRSSMLRILAVLTKEFIQIRRDRLTFAMMLGVPVMQLVLFGFAISTDPKDLPTAILDLSRDRFSRAIVASLENTGYYRITHLPSTAEEAEALMATGKVAFLVTIPSDIGRRAQRGDRPQILLEADASDPAASSGAVGVLDQVARRALERELGQEVQSQRKDERELSIIVHRRYNPEGVTQYNIVPGLLGVILQMTMVMMTALSLTREVERGTMENLLAMPVQPAELMAGKITPYFGIGAVQVMVILTFAKLLFNVPFVGSVFLLLTALFIYIVALVLLGYTFSTLARTQMQAMQLTFFFFLPSILLSGFMFPFSGMPRWAQAVGEGLPLTHFLRVVRGIMLKGSAFSDLHGEFLALALFVSGFAGLALLRFRRTLD
jgi:ABC-2 type transport system permease protein